jgi:uncharacterized protein (TIGR03435 family)
VIAALVGVFVTALGAQQPAPQAPDPNVPIAFEVASVKPNTSGQRGGLLRRQPGGRMEATNMPLRQLISFAYQAAPFTLVGGPSWIDGANFDIVAKLEGDPPMIPPGSGPDHLTLALRTLLADRFKLKVHRETRDLDVYALTMAKPGGGPGKALKASTEDCSPETIRARMAAGRGAPPAPAPGQPFQCGVRMSTGRIVTNGLPISAVLGALGGMVGRVVVDRTGLTGGWDLDVTFAPEAGRGGQPSDVADPNAPSIFTALQEQLGLKLESTKAPIEVTVIDSVEQPTPD